MCLCIQRVDIYKEKEGPLLPHSVHILHLSELDVAMYLRLSSFIYLLTTTVQKILRPFLVSTSWRGQTVRWPKNPSSSLCISLLVLTILIGFNFFKPWFEKLRLTLIHQSIIILLQRYSCMFLTPNTTSSSTTHWGYWRKRLHLNS